MTKKRRISEEVAKQRKEIINFIQDSAVSSYDISQYMGFDKVKTNNMLRAMEEDGILIQDGTADSHPVGRGRPPFMWRLANADFWKKIHGSSLPESTESSFSDGMNGANNEEEENEEDKVKDDDVDEKVTPQEMKLDNIEVKDGGTSSVDDSDQHNAEEEHTTSDNFQESESASGTAIKSGRESYIDAQSTVKVVIVFKDKHWVDANGKNILKYRGDLRNGNATIFDVPGSCMNIGTYIDAHEKELDF